MSNEQKISIELAIKIWGGIISLLLSVLLYVYISDMRNQSALNERAAVFMYKQSIMNNVIFDMISDEHPGAEEKIARYINRYESTTTRTTK